MPPPGCVGPFQEHSCCSGDSGEDRLPCVCTNRDRAWKDTVKTIDTLITSEASDTAAPLWRGQGYAGAAGSLGRSEELPQINVTLKRSGFRLVAGAGPASARRRPEEGVRMGTGLSHRATESSPCSVKQGREQRFFALKDGPFR